MKRYILTTLLFLPLALNSQTAVVQQLTPAEAVKVKSLYDAKSKAEEDYMDYKASLGKKYNLDDLLFTFSSDFKFAVPPQGDTVIKTNSNCLVPDSTKLIAPLGINGIRR